LPKINHVKTFKVIGLIGLVFLAGFAGGVVATRMVVRQMAYAAAHPVGSSAGKVEANLDRKLRLTDDQRQQIHEILKTSREKLRDVREEFQPQFNSVVLDARTNISALLKPEQQRRFDQFLADNRQFLPIREMPQPRKNSPGTGTMNALPGRKQKANPDVN
jgi:Spy/CpxP family protein refolding chaperone